MITYVNTVLVGKGVAEVLDNASAVAKATAKNTASADVNKYVVEKIDNEKFRVGLVTGKNTEAYVNDELVYSPIIKWSNDIKINDIKSYVVTNYDASAVKEDVITIDFTGAKYLDVLARGNKRVILRLTFKDLPTRFRKWTESYEYVTAVDDTAEDIAKGLADQIKKNYKRARIVPEVKGNQLVLTAMPYDDDDTVDSISPANKVRFTANVWYTDPMAHGFASKNKYAVGCTITKVPGISQVGEWKQVRDAEAQAMGYQGILNRGDGTWPIIKPEMNVQMNQVYDTLTLEFENMYRAADDIFRKTKQTLQIFDYDGAVEAVKEKIDAIFDSEP
uniref:Uncharacterized protein n=1 Tax=Dulem virus 42 TaxID=3145760 RepID=A0AAU8B9N2_9CAUD